MFKRPPKEKQKWIEGCMKELQEFARRSMWRIIKMHAVPPGRKLMSSKWVFKKEKRWQAQKQISSSRIYTDTRC